jgi:hypothetical protein
VKPVRSAPKKKSLRVGRPAPPDPTTVTKEDLDERRKTIERLGDLTERVEEGEEGEEGAMPALRGLLDENPDLVWRLGDVARAAENVLLRELTNKGEHPITGE